MHVLLRPCVAATPLNSYSLCTWIRAQSSLLPSPATMPNFPCDGCMQLYEGWSWELMSLRK